jgi:hypothetical protein
MPGFLALKAEALYLADRTPEALEVIKEAESLADRFEQRMSSAELHGLRGVFLATLGAEETQIAASFCAAVKTAKEQKSVSLQKRAEGTYAEYRRQMWIPTTSLVTARSAPSGFGCAKSSVIKQTLEMQSENTSAAKEACLARGAG